MVVQGDPPSLLPGATRAQSIAILGAMRAVAETGGTATQADMLAIASTDRYIFGHTPPADPANIRPVDPAALQAALRGSRLAEPAVKFMTVMAFVDGSLDREKFACVVRFSSALGVAERYLDEIKDAAAGRLQEALADMTRCNMASITGHPWEGDVNRWLLPYRDAPDTALAKRFAALSALPATTLGHAFWSHFKANNYAFPGEPDGLNAGFSVPHDCTHVLTGYGTDAPGELLTSTFTAAMDPEYPMAGHVLPVIFSWHLRLQINDVARQASGALDPQEFWRAWAAGAAANVDTFAAGWDFWSYVDEPLAVLRSRWAIPAGGLTG